MFNEFELMVIGVALCFVGLFAIEWLSQRRRVE
jgi:hypothetical protein